MGGVTPPRRVKERGDEQPERRRHEEQESHAGAECVLLVITKRQKKTRKGLTEGERRQAEVDTNKQTRGAQAGVQPKKKTKKKQSCQTRS